MKTSRIAVTLALLSVAGAASAQSFIPGNQIDDFGPVTYSQSASSSAAPLLASRSSPIPANYIDSFGPLVSERGAVQPELGAGGGEPGMDVVAAQRAQEKATLHASARDQFLRSVWAVTP